MGIVIRKLSPARS